jgi:hypothetical protein
LSTRASEHLIRLRLSLFSPPLCSLPPQPNHTQREQKEIFYYYLRTWFFFDLVATFPWTLIAVSNDHIRGLAALRLLRLLALFHIIDSDARDPRNIFTSLSWRLGKLAIMCLGLAHWLGCAWVLLSESEGYATEAEAADGSMLATEDFSQRTLGFRYFRALHWYKRTELSAKMRVCMDQFSLFHSWPSLTRTGVFGH